MKTPPLLSKPKSGYEEEITVKGTAVMNVAKKNLEEPLFPQVIEVIPPHPCCSLTVGLLGLQEEDRVTFQHEQNEEGV